MPKIRLSSSSSKSFYFILLVTVVLVSEWNNRNCCQSGKQIIQWMWQFRILVFFCIIISKKKKNKTWPVCACVITQYLSTLQLSITVVVVVMRIKELTFDNSTIIESINCQWMKPKKKIYNWFVYVIPESSWLENYSYSQTNGLYRL